MIPLSRVVQGILQRMGTIKRLTSMVSELIRDFHSGQFARIVAHYDFPLALHLEDRLVLLPQPADLERYLVDFLAAARAAKIVSTEARVLAVDLPRRGRFRAWVHYNHLDATGGIVAQSERTFFCRDLGNRIVVEMLELTRLPVDCLRHWSPEQRLIA
jgi:plasmid stabilization system protein ParE